MINSVGRTWFIVHPQGLIARRDGGRVILPGDAEAAQLGLDAASAHPISRTAAPDAVAVAFAELPTAPFEILSLRTLASSVDAETFSAAGRAMHVIDWATTNRYCGRCGTKTVPHETERRMDCPSCGLSAYPRIAPAIIVLVRRGAEALLARNAKFPGAFFSTLAGFSEIGESLEGTLAREVREEVGIGVKNIRYFGSQPWPFPHSLMIGFNAEWADGEIKIDGNEIAEANWFTVDMLPKIPPSLSIARQLIDAWINELNSPQR